MYFNICKICNANLDPGEKCDCRDERKNQELFFSKLIKVNPETIQLEFDWKGLEGVNEEKIVS